MKRAVLLEEINNALQREEPLSEDVRIADIREWDSLTVISIIALFDKLFGINLALADLNEAMTIRDLMNKAQHHLEQE